MKALVWLTWRQHRWQIIGVGGLALLAAIALLSSGSGRRPPGSMSLAGFYGLTVQLVFGGVIGVFWGAPLLARELEERTYFVAWGQDVSPTKWLRGKVVVLGVLAVALGAAIGVGDGFTDGRQPSWSAFESIPLVQAGYAVFGLALGVLIGLLTRHVVTAMAATLVFYTLVRALLSLFVRDHYLPPERVAATWDRRPIVPPGGLEVGGGFVDRELLPVEVPEQCERFMPSPQSCLRSSDAAFGTYVEYQPIGRMWIFQLIESGVFVLLAAVLLAVAFRLLRWGGGWKPSRSHRRIPAGDAPVQSAPETVAAQAEG